MEHGAGLICIMIGFLLLGLAAGAAYTTENYRSCERLCSTSISSCCVDDCMKVQRVFPCEELSPIGVEDEE